MKLFSICLQIIISFFTNNVSPLGEITNMEFIKVENGFNYYLTEFGSAKFETLMALDLNGKINGFTIVPHKDENLPKLERNRTKMILPFKEEWFVVWGGTTVAENYHVAYENQKGAYDLLIVKDKSTHKGSSDKNENYYVFGKDVIAPCDAKVVKVVTGVIDNIPGQMNPKQATGNTVVLETSQNEFIVFAHFKEKSIVVKEGQEVKQGDLLGQCGNSGNSTEPHLHLSLQNILDDDMATGAKLYFDKILVNGEIKEDYLPVKNEKIQNIKL